jgi:hypothetical protein
MRAGKLDRMIMIEWKTETVDAYTFRGIWAPIAAVCA